jgi:succinyl-CoA:acetate CoA-transferase
VSIDHSRIMSPALRSKIMSADDAAALVPHGANVGMSGFTGSGYPKAVPMALARRIEQAQARGEEFRIGVWTGASTAPELDGALAKVNGIELRLPYQSDPVTRERINAVYRHPPQPCRAVRLVRFSRASGCRTG